MDASGHGIVLVHGGMCTAACWDRVIEHLTIPVTAVDLPGRRDSQADLRAVTLDDCVRAVIDAADRSGWQRVTLIGHSLGGVTITETAFRYPERVARLVYVGALIPAPGRSGCMTQSGADWPSDEIVEIDEAIAKAIFATDLTDAEWTDIWPSFVPEAPGLINANLSGYPDDIPTTYITLVHDAAVPPALCAEMIGNLAGPVDRVEIPAGHMVMYSRPKELAHAISDALAAR